MGQACPAPAGRRREFVMRRADFQAVADLVYAKAGIVLGTQKQELVYSRLARRLRALGMTSFAAYLAFLESDQGGGEVEELVNAITTNHTRFFREAHHFDYVRDVAAPMWTKRAEQSGETSVRLWSAGCSTGEEPYSLAIALARAGAGKPWNWKILATDIDTSVLACARAGEYPSSVAADIPADRRAASFDVIDGGRVRMKSELRARITFNRLNLLEAWPIKTRFDGIFCRNVTIYFDAETKRRLIQRLVGALKPGGFLALGHSESLLGAGDGLKVAARTLYTVADAREARR